MIIKYSVKHSRGIREFLDQIEANNFAQENNSTVDVIELKESSFVEVPQKVTPRQMRVALIMSGTSISSIETMIAALPEPDQSIVRTTWEYSTYFDRNNEILNSMASNLGLTQLEVDNLFILADTL